VTNLTAWTTFRMRSDCPLIGPRSNIRAGHTLVLISHNEFGDANYEIEAAK
jgi:hypothetical protein